MFWTITCRVMATVITFSIGFVVFAIASPTEELRLPESSPQILAITLKRHGCSDAERKCPVYEATFRNDGTCTYIGYANDEFIGKFEAQYDVDDFNAIVKFVDREGFFGMPRVFTTGPVVETTSIEVVTSEDAKFVTTHNWANTPIGLRALQAVLEQQTYEVEWEERP